MRVLAAGPLALARCAPVLRSARRPSEPERLDTVVLGSRPAIPSREPEQGPLPAGLGLETVDSVDGSVRYGPQAGELRRFLESRQVRVLGIRHGQTEANRVAETTGQPLLCGRSESPLTPKGRSQAEEAAARLYEELAGDAWLLRAATVPELLPVVLTSPLSRARDTAERLMEHLNRAAERLHESGLLPAEGLRALRQGLKLQVDPRLREMDFGHYEQKLVAELRADHPRFCQEWDSYQGEGVDFRHRFPGGESRADVAARVAGLLRDLGRDFPGRTVLLFAHQETLVAARTVLGLGRMDEGKLRADAPIVKNATPIRLCSPTWLGETMDRLPLFENPRSPGHAFQPGVRGQGGNPPPAHEVGSASQRRRLG